MDSYPRRWWALIALGLSMLAIGLDMTILTTALPTLAGDLHATNSQLQWIADAYMLVLAAAVLPAGLLGDRFGRRKFIVLGLVLFAAGSAWCAWSGSANALIGARVLLGLGAAILTPLSMSILAVLFEPHERQRAVALMSMFTMVGIPLGPIVGGALLEHFWWGSVFALNLPMAAIAIVAVITLMPETRGEQTRRIDLVGIATSSLGLVGITYGLIQGPSNGWTSGGVLGGLVGGLAVLIAFVVWERRTAHPLLDISLFSSRIFTSGTALATIIAFAMFGAFYALPQLFQAVLGAGPQGTGLRMLPLIGGLLVGFQITNRLAPRTGPTPPLVGGFALMALGAMIGTGTGPHTGFGYVALWTVIFGLGIGFSLPTAMVAAMGALSKSRAGVGTAMLMAFRQVGSVLGIAILGTVLSVGYHSRLDTSGLPAAAGHAARDSASAGVAVAAQLHSDPLLGSVRAAFTHGMDITLWVTAAVALAGMVLAALVLPRRRPTPVEAESEHAVVV
ncbi:MAG TPA: DHA2 family efflux MFS transporter permease subunit [Mycobacteriales bacterium]|nr:DHA2 family efflux MFS transporter permease subunit [Mycobacteriales bacterium]